ncbi:hypothetical protein FQN54_003028 [Arachnomyces sp. PD_36]|nr:hypothetical protein FQN54_003028 [Arachnomyces sp. PD_36]
MNNKRRLVPGYEHGPPRKDKVWFFFAAPIKSDGAIYKLIVPLLPEKMGRGGLMVKKRWTFSGVEGDLHSVRLSAMWTGDALNCLLNPPNHTSVTDLSPFLPGPTEFPFASALPRAADSPPFPEDKTLCIWTLASKPAGPLGHQSRGCIKSLSYCMAISIAGNPESRPGSVGSLTRPFSLFPDIDKGPHSKHGMWHRFGLSRWLGRDDPNSSSNKNNPSPKSTTNGSKSPNNFSNLNGNGHLRNTTNNGFLSPWSSDWKHNQLARRFSKKIGAGLPPPTACRRQESEQRDRLAPNDLTLRRTVSTDHHTTLSSQRTRSPHPRSSTRLSAPEVQCYHDSNQEVTDVAPPVTNDLDSMDLERFQTTTSADGVLSIDEDIEDMLETELDRKWILNLSMRFRDGSEREKFFITYAEAPNRWRRVTVTCDYRDAPPDSLEHDLKELRYQRDKNAQIYKSIRESLPEIEFHDTVTNLKLETSGGRLHVHVSEDANEVIPYPPVSNLGHLETRWFRECELEFDAHLSGFVYKVRSNGKQYIKKEIPGPDTVPEFFYEIDALHALSGSQSVIGFEGIVMDDDMRVIKGLLISYAEKGSLADLIYDYRGNLTWEKREHWAKQIVQGLTEIHEAGYVQGDFTLSNIVVDENDNAKIIDINRRGCPIGWEPPEIVKKIESKQRISMYIGVKSDIFQLGMTLWALAMEDDEPDRQIRPLTLPADAKIPEYYRKLVSICLSPKPQDRLSAKELLTFFPQDTRHDSKVSLLSPPQEQVFYLGSEYDACHAPQYLQPSAAAVGQPAEEITIISKPASMADDQSQYNHHWSNPDRFHHPQFPHGSSAETRNNSFLEDHMEPQIAIIDPHDQTQRLDEAYLDEIPAMTRGSSFNLPDSRPTVDRTQTVHCEDVIHPELYNPSHGDRSIPNDEPTVEAKEDNSLSNAIPITHDLFRSLPEPTSLPIMELGTLPGDLAGVGGHPQCSIDHGSTQLINPYWPETTGPDLHWLRHPSSESWETDIGPISLNVEQDPVLGFSDLFNSKLPINPAFTQHSPRPQPWNDRDHNRFGQYPT